MKYLASCSFGKDSLAAIITWLEHGNTIDHAVYCKIMFDAETDAELPEHTQWIYETAIPLLKKRYGVETAIVQADITYTEQFFTEFQRGKNIGRIYGFPYRCGAWCNSRLKRQPLNKHEKSAGEYRRILGIAADEHKRKNGKAARNAILPLDIYGITEKMAFDICKENGLLSPAYNGGRFRLGCWFCHNQKISEFRRLRSEYPALWQKLMVLDSYCRHKFTPQYTVHELDNRFHLEELEEKH